MRKETKALSSTFSFVSYYLEPRVGLSHARNAAIAHCKTPWIGFIDDDSTIEARFIQQALKHIKEGKVKVFGGHIESEWSFGRPKWLRHDFGSKPIISNQIMLLEEDYLWGGNMFFCLSILRNNEGFNGQVGLFGSIRGYSADNLIQKKLRSDGLQILYDPYLIVHHTVLPEKLRWYWHVKWAYYTARDGLFIFPEQYVWKRVVRTGFSSITGPFRSIFNWLTKDTYYWQNVVIDGFSPFAVFLGKCLAHLKSKHSA